MALANVAIGPVLGYWSKPKNHEHVNLDTLAG